MIIDDNFLDPQHISDLESFLTSQDFPWFFSGKTITGKKEEFLPNTYKSNQSIMEDYMKDGNQFTHLLYFDDRPQSDFFDQVKKIFDIFCEKHNINKKSIIRSKINLVESQKDSFVYPAHVDLPYEHNVFIYYVNDSDGDTIVFNEKFGKDKISLSKKEKISPKAGRAIMFNGLNYHSPMSPVESDYRIVINIAFI